MARLIDIEDERFWNILFDEACVEGQQATRIKNVLEKIIAYDVEKVVAELEEIYDQNDKDKKEAYEDEDWELFDIFMHRNEGVYIALTMIRNGGKE